MAAADASSLHLRFGVGRYVYSGLYPAVYYLLTTVLLVTTALGGAMVAPHVLGEADTADMNALRSSTFGIVTLAAIVWLYAFKGTEARVTRRTALGTSKRTLDAPRNPSPFAAVFKGMLVMLTLTVFYLIKYVMDTPLGDAPIMMFIFVLFVMYSVHFSADNLTTNFASHTTGAGMADTEIRDVDLDKAYGHAPLMYTALSSVVFAVMIEFDVFIIMAADEYTRHHRGPGASGFSFESATLVAQGVLAGVALVAIVFFELISRDGGAVTAELSKSVSFSQRMVLAYCYVLGVAPAATTDNSASAGLFETLTIMAKSTRPFPSEAFVRHNAVYMPTELQRWLPERSTVMEVARSTASVLFTLACTLLLFVVWYHADEFDNRAENEHHLVRKVVTPIVAVMLLLKITIYDMHLLTDMSWSSYARAVVAERQSGGGVPSAGTRSRFVVAPWENLGAVVSVVVDVVIVSAGLILLIVRVADFDHRSNVAIALVCGAGGTLLVALVLNFFAGVNSVTGFYNVPARAALVFFVLSGVFALVTPVYLHLANRWWAPSETSIDPLGPWWAGEGPYVFALCYTGLACALYAAYCIYVCHGRTDKEQRNHARDLAEYYHAVESLLAGVCATILFVAQYAAVDQPFTRFSSHVVYSLTAVYPALVFFWCVVALVERDKVKMWAQYVLVALAAGSFVAFFVWGGVFDWHDMFKHGVRGVWFYQGLWFVLAYTTIMVVQYGYLETEQRRVRHMHRFVQFAWNLSVLLVTMHLVLHLYLAGRSGTAWATLMTTTVLAALGYCVALMVQRYWCDVRLGAADAGVGGSGARAGAKAQSVESEMNEITQHQEVDAQMGGATMYVVPAVAAAQRRGYVPMISAGGDGEEG